VFIYLFIKLRPSITCKEKEKEEKAKKNKKKTKNKKNRQQNKTKWPGEPLQLSQLQRTP